MEPNQYLIDFYSHYDEEGRLASRHGSVEFLTTMGYLSRYLRPGCRVLEIGAGTGRYSHALARQGYQVDAVELVEHNLNLFRQGTTPGEQITVVQGNALDLSAFPDNTYDITLLLGPLYHLYTEEDKRQALGEAIRVTRQGGRPLRRLCYLRRLPAGRGIPSGEGGCWGLPAGRASGPPDLCRCLPAQGSL